ncbi:MAG: beta-lactamase family protein, partial [Treponema sp.]|nr:beta-lactamase family protein [Treponema sp.]
MFIKIGRLIAVLCIWGFALSALPAQNILDPSWSGVADEIRPKIQQRMSESDIKGLMIVLVDEEKTVWSEGFGFSDISTNKKVDADTMFEIGSVSKTFSGLMVMQLYEQGKLDIDKPLVTYIPEFKLMPPVGNFPRVD